MPCSCRLACFKQQPSNQLPAAPPLPPAQVYLAQWNHTDGELVCNIALHRNGAKPSQILTPGNPQLLALLPSCCSQWR